MTEIEKAKENLLAEMNAYVEKQTPEEKDSPEMQRFQNWMSNWSKQWKNDLDKNRSMKSFERYFDFYVNPENKTVYQTYENLEKDIFGIPFHAVDAMIIESRATYPVTELFEKMKSDAKNTEAKDVETDSWVEGLFPVYKAGWEAAIASLFDLSGKGGNTLTNNFKKYKDEVLRHKGA